MKTLSWKTKNRGKVTYDVPEIVLDIEKAKALFKWQPEISMQEGLLLQFDWMSKNMRRMQI